MVKEGSLIGTGKRFGIVVSRFNEHVTKALLDGTLNHLRRSGVRETDIEAAWVPGTFEIPLTLQTMARQKQFDGLVVLGCLIRGETSNYAHIAQSTTDSIMQVMLTCEVPIGFGLLTVDTLEQALNRSGGKFGNKGREAAEAVIEMVNLIAVLKPTDSTNRQNFLRAATQTWERFSMKEDMDQ
ncbi:MAG: 6,7-dimethyl-8-ribityllumazine synthase [Candidatus Omnitrophica bacterium CG11_big_fil_rev_8_21_14_0_20_45_26]|uniref:6,7-dimethyl-8-ribityllumazine synthase n=1 Tax=Candidatus Abzuiibacterium crystallinum TaxID=1974748 RepID=A0A2H0LPQ1_9BACT|nr:MAG: 6,7-dimethyl-8-ribityllumazine synthase [Candidatus Omnitrophica bacterium CG11_big_fil_rev_8_21_14_0_20_45_26]PIW65237.1 MAG: 6,7-dimethyl-8-ribityllumazine synthase [Candidatus Omnitrophica bacterium CG12_big_fil_rev_8_21_14_0_65_45_16]